ncbi:MAG TPA: hypothetical protein VNA68_03140 [Candidatus Dormibacteraeota bacterium]|nr:hypothetical protein [Candidatus Dormibacteraeota bacterium]
MSKKTKIASILGGFLVSASLFLTPSPTYAFGLGCEGIIQCSIIYALVFASWAGYLIGLIILLFILARVGQRIFKWQISIKRLMIIMLVGALVFTSLAFFAYSMITKTMGGQRFQNVNQQKLSKINFPVYEPKYLPAGYQLAENKVNDFSRTIEFRYYNGSPGKHRNTQAKKRIEITEMAKTKIVEEDGKCLFSNSFVVTTIEGHPRCEKIYKDPTHYWYSLNDRDIDRGYTKDDHIGIVTRDQTTIIITYNAISRAEVTKILDGLKQVDPKDIKFYTDWPEEPPIS